MLMRMHARVVGRLVRLVNMAWWECGRFGECREGGCG